MTIEIQSSGASHTIARMAQYGALLKITLTNGTSRAQMVRFPLIMPSAHSLTEVFGWMWLLPRYVLPIDTSPLRH